jgi:hypothetical protein
MDACDPGAVGSAAHPNALPVNTVQSFYSRPSVTLGEKKGIRVIICVVVEAPRPDWRATVFGHMASRIANSVLAGAKVAVRIYVAPRMRASNGPGWIDDNVERTDGNNGRNKSSQSLLLLSPSVQATRSEIFEFSRCHIELTAPSMPLWQLDADDRYRRRGDP